MRQKAAEQRTGPSIRPASRGHPIRGCLATRKRAACRACSGTDLLRFLSLGPTPLANAFLNRSDDFVGEGYYPLDVYLCRDCSLVQLLDVVDPEILFRNYIYLTGTSTTMEAHNREYAATMVELLQLEPDDLVIEIASNDGSLLKHFSGHGVRILGIEPATNIARLASGNGIPTVNRFFDSACAGLVRERYGRARAVIANNVLAHVDGAQDFLRGCKLLLEEGGLLVVEVPYLLELVDRLEYDTVYHEHLCYFSVTSLLRLYESVGLSVIRVDRVAVHGGSLRVYATARERCSGRSAAVTTLVESERVAGLNSPERFERFAAGVWSNRRALRRLLEGLRRQGKVVAGYGAPAKGNTLLNYCDIGPELVAYTVDKNPLKVGLYTPGKHLPVEPVSVLEERRPDYLLILAWNMADEIIEQQQAHRTRGGQFIIPIPEPRIL